MEILLEVNDSEISTSIYNGVNVPHVTRKLWIDNTKDLSELIEHMKHVSVVAIDTEFMREKSYFPRLCLLQIAFDDTVALIDPFGDIDLSLLESVLCDPQIMKVFHAGAQDLEILFQIIDKPVTPLFDTQSAASLIGLPDQVGYGAMVQEVLAVSLGKADSFTDWARRPLSEAQIVYAREDVTYLLAAYPVVIQRLEDLGRASWLDEEFAHKASLDYVTVDPREQWRRVKKVSMLNRRQTAVAREIAAWRELEAMRLNLPKRWVLGDESVIEIARRLPKNHNELENIRGVGHHALRQTKHIVGAIDTALNLSEDELPVLPRRRKSAHDVDASVDLMVALSRQRAKENNIAISQLAPRPLLEELAQQPRKDNPILTGWRKAMVGEELLALLEGAISLSLDNGKLTVSEAPSKEE